VAPLTVLNFVGLAEGTQEWLDPKTGQKTTAPLYTGTTFHRVIPNFMIQGGDPKGNGTGGPGYKFQDEPHAQVTFAEPGKLAMANSGPNTNGSQFFITEGSPTHLNGKHTIFGHCHDLSVVKQIARVEAGPRNAPAVPVVINAIEIVRAGQEPGAEGPDGVVGEDAADQPPAGG
jgi:peptidyl-prolyl cis-trans isomerase A (cyclophilin A)